MGFDPRIQAVREKEALYEELLFDSQEANNKLPDATIQEFLGELFDAPEKINALEKEVVGFVGQPIRLFPHTPASTHPALGSSSTLSRSTLPATPSSTELQTPEKAAKSYRAIITNALHHFFTNTALHERCHQENAMKENERDCGFLLQYLETQLINNINCVLSGQGALIPLATIRTNIANDYCSKYYAINSLLIALISMQPSSARSKGNISLRDAVFVFGDNSYTDNSKTVIKIPYEAHTKKGRTAAVILYFCFLIMHTDQELQKNHLHFLMEATAINLPEILAITDENPGNFLNAFAENSQQELKKFFDAIRKKTSKDSLDLFSYLMPEESLSRKEELITRKIVVELKLLENARLAGPALPNLQKLEDRLNQFLKDVIFLRLDHRAAANIIKGLVNHLNFSFSTEIARLSGKEKQIACLIDTLFALTKTEFKNNQVIVFNYYLHYQNDSIVLNFSGRETTHFAFNCNLPIDSAAYRNYYIIFLLILQVHRFECLPPVFSEILNYFYRYQDKAAAAIITHNLGISQSSISPHSYANLIALFPVCLAIGSRHLNAYDLLNLDEVQANSEIKTTYAFFKNSPSKNLSGNYFPQYKEKELPFIKELTEIIISEWFLNEPARTRMVQNLGLREDAAVLTLDDYLNHAALLEKLHAYLIQDQNKDKKRQRITFTFNYLLPALVGPLVNPNSTPQRPLFFEHSVPEIAKQMQLLVRATPSMPISYSLFPEAALNYRLALLELCDLYIRGGSTSQQPVTTPQAIFMLKFMGNHIRLCIVKVPEQVGTPVEIKPDFKEIPTLFKDLFPYKDFHKVNSSKHYYNLSFSEFERLIEMVGAEYKRPLAIGEITKTDYLILEDGRTTNFKSLLNIIKYTQAPGAPADTVFFSTISYASLCCVSAKANKIQQIKKTFPSSLTAAPASEPPAVISEKPAPALSLTAPAVDEPAAAARYQQLKATLSTGQFQKEAERFTTLVQNISTYWFQHDGRQAQLVTQFLQHQGSLTVAEFPEQERLAKTLYAYLKTNDRNAHEFRLCLVSHLVAELYQVNKECTFQAKSLEEFAHEIGSEFANQASTLPEQSKLAAATLKEAAQTLLDVRRTRLELFGNCFDAMLQKNEETSTIPTFLATPDGSKIHLEILQLGINTAQTRLAAIADADGKTQKILTDLKWQPIFQYSNDRPNPRITLTISYEQLEELKDAITFKQEIPSHIILERHQYREAPLPQQASPLPPAQKSSPQQVSTASKGKEADSDSDSEDESISAEENAAEGMVLDWQNRASKKRQAKSSGKSQGSSKRRALSQHSYHELTSANLSLNTVAAQTEMIKPLSGFESYKEPAAPITMTLQSYWSAISNASVQNLKLKVLNEKAVEAVLKEIIPLNYPILDNLKRVVKAPLNQFPVLVSTLKNYQLEELADICAVEEAGAMKLLAAEMGTGKTWMFGAWLVHKVYRGASQPLLEICPACILTNAFNEMRQIFSEGIFAAWKIYLQLEPEAAKQELIKKIQDMPLESSVKDGKKLEKSSLDPSKVHLQLALFSLLGSGDIGKSFNPGKLYNHLSYIYPAGNQLLSAKLNNLAEESDQAQAAQKILEVFESICNMMMLFKRTNGPKVEAWKKEFLSIKAELANGRFDKTRLEKLADLSEITSIHPSQTQENSLYYGKLVLASHLLALNLSRKPLNDKSIYDLESVKRLARYSLEKIAICRTADEFTSTTKTQLGANSLLLTTYDAFKIAYTREKTFFNQISFGAVVADEAQKLNKTKLKFNQTIREWFAGLAQNEKTLPPFMPATGTPIENDLLELWSLLVVGNSGNRFESSTHASLTKLLNKSVEYFQDLSCGRTTKLNEAVVLKAFAQFCFFRNITAQLVTNITTSDPAVIRDWNGFPERQDIPLPIPLAPEAKQKIDEAFEEYSMCKRTGAKKQPGKSRQFTFQAKMVKILLNSDISSEAAFNEMHPDVQKIREILTTGTSSEREALIQKMPLLQALLSADKVHEIFTQNKKALLFFQHLAKAKIVLEFFKVNFSDSNPKAYFYQGSTKQPQRDEMVSWFKDKKIEPKLFGLQVDAAGVGLNLGNADIMIPLFFSFNPQKIAQALARGLRVGHKGVKQVLIPKLDVFFTAHLDAVQAAKKAMAGFIFAKTENLQELFTLWLKQLQAIVNHKNLTESKNTSVSTERDALLGTIINDLQARYTLEQLQTFAEAAKPVSSVVN